MGGLDISIGYLVRDACIFILNYINWLIICGLGCKLNIVCTQQQFFVAFSFLSFIPTLLCFHSRWFHLAYVFLCAFQATYNGSKFYASVYGKRNFVRLKTEHASAIIAKKMASRDASPNESIPSGNEQSGNVSDGQV